MNRESLDNFSIVSEKSDILTSPPEAPSSSLQLIHSPCIRYRRFLSPYSTFMRTRTTARVSLSLVGICVLVMIWNELRCVKYGCVSRTEFYGGEGVNENAGTGRFVGGGSVVKKVTEAGHGNKGESKEEDTKSIWKPKGWISTSHGKDRGSDTGGGIAGEQESFQEGKGILITPTRPANPYATVDPKDQEQARTPVPSGKANDKASSTTATTAASSISFPFAIPTTQTATVTSWGRELAAARTSTGLIHPLPSIVQVPASPNPRIQATFPAKVEDDEAWDGQEDDPLISKLGAQFKQTAAEQHAKWEQGVGQEDPIRVKNGLGDGRLKQTGMKGVLGVMDMGGMGAIGK